MTESNPLQGWELEDAPEGSQQWQLLDDEQELPSALQMTPDPAAPVQNWRPVDYEEPRYGGRGGWILPLFIVAAMVAVIGYIVWLGLGGFGLGTTVQAPAGETPGSDPSVVVVDTPTAIPPTATTEPPTATPLPQPTATATQVMIDQTIAIINNEYGVNARSAPSLDADVVTLLEYQTRHRVLDDAGDWLQLALEDGTPVFISSQFADLATEQISAPPGTVIAGATPVAEAEQPSTAPAQVAATDVLTTGIIPPQPFTAVIPAGPAVIVRTEAGVNARADPNTDGAILALVPQGAALPADARSEDGEWLRVTLSNGDQGWMFGAAVETSGATDTLPLPAAAVEAAPVITTTTGIAPSDEPADGGVAVVPTVIIDNLVGANVRAAPVTTAEVIEFVAGNSEWPAIGRTADSEWIQIELADGRTAWVFRIAVQLNVAPETLPVVTP